MYVVTNWAASLGFTWVALNDRASAMGWNVQAGKCGTKNVAVMVALPTTVYNYLSVRGELHGRLFSSLLAYGERSYARYLAGCRGNGALAHDFTRSARE